MKTIQQRLLAEILEIEEAIEEGDIAAYHMVTYKGLDHYRELLRDAYQALQPVQLVPGSSQKAIDAWDKFMTEYERDVRIREEQEKLNVECRAAIERLAIV